MKKLTSPALVSLILLSAMCAAQDAPQKSLADIARESQAKKEHAKTVISNDNLTVEKKTLPAISFEGLDNSDEIFNGMDAYCKEHTTKECEDTIHAWYDKYLDVFNIAFEENKTLTAREQDRRDNPSYYNPNRDAKQNYDMRQAQMRSSRNDYNKYKQNGLAIARIQQAFIKIRSSLMGTGRRYAWFKVPNGNGNGSF